MKQMTTSVLKFACLLFTWWQKKLFVYR
jgi:hypothetical protein